MKDPITITDKAAEAIAKRVKNGPEGALGLRLTVKPTGCSGNSYDMEYISADTDVSMDDVFEQGESKLYVPKTVSWMLFGIEIDYAVNELGNEAFIFNNPNEVDRCGCGESFRVQ